MFVSDGNDMCARSNHILILELTKNIKRNFQEGEIQSSILIWDEHYVSAEKYDYIVISECVYYIKCHDALIGTLKAMMHEKSTCIMIAPKRGVTMDKFVENAKQTFKVEVSEKICPEIDARIAEVSKHKLFRASTHRPYLIILHL